MSNWSACIHGKKIPGPCSACAQMREERKREMKNLKKETTYLLKYEGRDDVEERLVVLRSAKPSIAPDGQDADWCGACRVS